MKKNILINLLTYNSGGAKIFKKNYIQSLSNIDKTSTENIFYVLNNEVEESTNPNVNFLKIPQIFENIIFLPITYFLIIPILINKHKIDSILNFCDIPIRTKIYQIFYFDWPYAVYPESVVWKRMDFYDKIYRLTKLFLFKKLIRRCDLIIAQSQVIASRIKEIYNFEKIEVIRMGFENKFKKNKSLISKSDRSDRILLYPTKYYPHKNVEILIDVAKELKKRKLNYKIFCTIDKNHHKNVLKIIQKIKSENLSDLLIITGELNRKDFNELFKKSIAILMPTLLETYGIPYIEAIASNKIIFTSDLDFAHITCGEAAFYFDPFDPLSIVSVIDNAFKNSDLILEKSKKGLALLEDQKSWAEIMTKINLLIIK